MTTVPRLILFALLLAQLAPAQFQSHAAQTRGSKLPAETAAAARSCAQKIAWLQENGSRPHPDQRPTVFTQEELDAYIAAGYVRLPPGVESLVVALHPGAMSATMQVNFDLLARHSGNPLLALFSGRHQVLAQAHGAGAGGRVRAHVDSVALDGDQVPRFLLALFVEKALQPRYPQASLDPVFALPEKIDLLELGEKKATVTQK